jgi:hypothetical protein
LITPSNAASYRLDEIGRHVLDRRRRLDAPRTQHAFDLLQIVRVHRRESAAPDRLRPRHDRAVGDRLRAIRNHFPGVDLDLRPEPAAGRTRAEGRVEREQPRLEFLEREPAVRACEGFAERQLLLRLRIRFLGRRRHRDVAAARLRLVDGLVEHGRDAARKTQRRLDRVGQALADIGLHHEPVDDDLDRVFLLLVEIDLVTQLFDLAVDPDAREALFADLLEQLRVLALAPANHRREELDARALGQRHHLIDDLFGALGAHFATALVTVRLPDAREQQAQVVVDLGDGADRRTRVARGRLLVDRDRGREALDVIDVGLLHLAQELARVRRERLDVAALAFGVDRIESERGLPRSRQPCDDDQPVPR